MPAGEVADALALRAGLVVERECAARDLVVRRQAVPGMVDVAPEVPGSPAGGPALAGDGVAVGLADEDGDGVLLGFGDGVLLGFGEGLGDGPVAVAVGDGLGDGVVLGAVDDGLGEGVVLSAVDGEGDGLPVVGAPVVGAPVVGAPVVGAPVVGAPVVGAPVVGAAVVEAAVVGDTTAPAPEAHSRTAADQAVIPPTTARARRPRPTDIRPPRLYYPDTRCEFDLNRYIVSR